MAPQLRCDEYMVVWVCGLSAELEAAKEMLDEFHSDPLSNTPLTDIFQPESLIPGIKNFAYGRVGEHNVVIACLPRKEDGTYSVTTVVEEIKNTFTSLRFGLMVGIGGGVPSEEADIRLGDVVVGSPYRTHGGVVQYNLGESGSFKRTGPIHTPPPVLLNAIANLQDEHMKGGRNLDEYLSYLYGPVFLARKAAGQDLLYAAEYDHKGWDICEQCDTRYLVDREPRSEESSVVVHYGTIASGHQVIKSATERDELSLKLDGVLCFETEIAGLINSFPCLVIRGICDYADSHGNAFWLKYAKATARAYARQLLWAIPRAEVAKMVTADEAMRELSDHRVIEEREILQTQVLWVDPESGQWSRNIKDFINKIAADGHIHCDSVTWEWELPAIPASDIEKDVVLVYASSKTYAAGDFVHVYATTYWEYLKQSKWANFIMETLSVLARVDLNLAQAGFSMYAMRDPPVWITCSYDNLSINFADNKTLFENIDLLEVLDWLCKSMRRPTDKDSHVVSSASYGLLREMTPSSENGISDSSILLNPARPYVSLKASPLPKIKYSCWLSFFHSCVIVDSPFAPNDSFGKGLETSFDLMIALAASEFCLKINGSLAFLGYRTLLYPVATEGNCAQFHLITTTHGQINPYILNLKKILHVEDHSQFKTMRCFVGWCEDAHINLGTQRLAADIKYTGGRDHPRSLEPDGYAIISQFGASAPLSAILGVQQNFKYSRHRIRFTPTKNYLELLQNTSQQSVVLYDSKQRRFWLVPKLSLLLHMAQRYTSCSPIPHANPHLDAQDLVSLLEPVGHINVLEGKAHKFELHELLMALNISMLETTRVLLGSVRGRLYGFEFQDIVRSPDRGSCMKELRIPSKRKAWFNIVNAVGTVIVCSNLGEVISVERSSTRKCDKCNRVPENEDYFTATVPCLARLAEQKGVDLIVGGDGINFSDKTMWKLKMNPFISCTHAENSKETCWEIPGLIQRVVRRVNFDLKYLFGASIPQSVRSTSGTPDLVKGAVVFG